MLLCIYASQQTQFHQAQATDYEKRWEKLRITHIVDATKRSLKRWKLKEANLATICSKLLITFSAGGGGTFTVSASSTLSGSSILLDSVDRYLPLPIEPDVLLCFIEQKSNQMKYEQMLVESYMKTKW